MTMLKPQDIRIGDYLLTDGKVIQVAAVHQKKEDYHERHDRLMPNYQGYHTMHYALRAMALAL